MQQTASVFGNGNTIVQIVGDTNFVNTAGKPHLSLTRFVARRQVRQDLDRLSPYARSTPLLGRQAELASLHAFLQKPRALLVRVLTGSAGSGKTRLALELCEEAMEMGWNSGFVTRNELRRFFEQQSPSAWGWQCPTLIVVDYAAEHAELLGRWLDELSDRAEPPKQPLRMLLLERDANTDIGWWAAVFRSGGYGATVKRALLDPAEPVPVYPLVQVEDRLELLHAVLAQSPGIRVPLVDDVLRSKLKQLDWGGNPLFLMMAAMAMSHVGHPQVLALGRTDLADSLAERESERIANLGKARGLGTELITHLVACVTLAQGMTRDEFESFAFCEKATIHRPGGGDVAALADVLQEALPRANGIAPVFPDLIGEALIVRTFQGKAGVDAVLRCHARFGQPVTTSVIRCAQDFGTHLSTPLHWLEAIAAAVNDDEAAIDALANGLPRESVVLREFNVKVAQRLRDLRAVRQSASAAEYAAALIGLANAEALAGMPEAALRSGRQAVSLYRELAAQRPEAFQPNLAMSLNTVSRVLDDLGQHEPALQVGQEAVDQFRELAARRPELSRPDLAMALNNLAITLSTLAQDEPALHAAQEAVELYQELAAERPDVFRPNWATSLGTLANMLSTLGQHEPAVHTAQEAVELYRELAAERPDVFRPNWATSLGTLAVVFSTMGQHEPALHAAQEAVDLFRDLATQRPAVFRPNLAGTLRVLAQQVRTLNGAKSALPFAHEAVTSLLPEFERHPNAYSRPMAEMAVWYVKMCSSANEPPDKTLLGRLLPYFTDKE